MNWKPNKWGAATLSFLAAPLGMLYVDRAWLAGVYFFALLGIALSQFWIVDTGYDIPLSLVFTAVAVTHTYRVAARAQEIESRPWFSRWYGLLVIVLVTVLAITSFRAFIYEPFLLPAQSMFPSTPKGSYVVVQKYGYGNYASYGFRLFRSEISTPLNRGDVFVFEFPRDRNISYIKRLIGLPGDHIEYKGKYLYVNSKPLPTNPIGSFGEFEIAQEASYKIANEHNVPSHDFDIKVEAGHLFFLGDNRDNSNDSRFWGQVPYDHIIGKVVLVLKDGKTQPAIPARVGWAE